MIQPAGDLRLEAGWPIGRIFALGAACAIAGALPSSLSGWYSYRGWNGWGLEIMGRALWPIAAGHGPPFLRAGAEVGAGAALLTYSDTTLVFFAPALRAAGLLAFTPAKLPYLDVRLEVPLTAWLRPDLSYSLALGLEVGLTFSTSRFRAAGGSAP